MCAGAFLLFLTATPWVAGSEKPDSLAEFDRWWQKYSDATGETRPAMEKEGGELAKKRRATMWDLMASAPENAIRWSFPEEYYTALPLPIRAWVEQHVRGLGALLVERNKDGATVRTVVLDDQSWTAWTYGRRLKLSTRDEIPVHGIVLGERMALDGSPLERFPRRDSLWQALRQSEGRKTCPICGEPGRIPAAAGDILFWFDREEHIATTEKALVEKEALPNGEE